MKVARLEFPLILQALLHRDQRRQQVEMRFQGPQTVKHLIESLGIPHTEIGPLAANRMIIGLDYIVHDGDRIEVQPVPQTVDGTSEPRFVLDGHLGRLASHLRMLGLDCLYDNAYEDDELVHISVEAGRILLTRDRLLLMHKVITQGYLLRSLNSTEQLYEVFERYGLVNWVRPLERCMKCNHLLEPVRKELVLEKLEPLTKKYYDEFKLCPSCDQVYWKGSHYERMLEVIEKLSHHVRETIQEVSMFKKSHIGKHTEVIKGVHIKATVYGAQTLLTEVRMEKGAVIPPHKHPHEQTGYMVSGHMDFLVGGEHFIATPGDSWNIPGNTEHGATAIEDSVVIEVFSPVREDYLPYFTPDE